LAEGNWPMLETLNLCIVIVIKQKIKWERKDVCPSLQQTGLFSNKFASVLQILPRQYKPQCQKLFQSQPGKMVSSHSFEFRYSFFSKIESNHIQDEGCKWLIRANWPNLK